MSKQEAQDVTQLLIELSQGNRVKVDLLLPLIYDELRSRFAARRMTALRVT